MNNYDDIKRFKEKLNMEAIDYKEIADNNPHSSVSSWTIIRQIVNADRSLHPLEQGHSTILPPPSPISQQEFSARSPAMAQQPPVAQGSAATAGIDRPAYGPSVFSPLFNAVDNALPPQTAAGSAPLACAMGAMGASRLANGPGSVFSQLTRQPASDSRASPSPRDPAPTDGNALPLQGGAAMFASTPSSGLMTGDPAQTPDTTPLTQAQDGYARAPGRAPEALTPQGNPFNAPHEVRSTSPFAEAQGQFAPEQGAARARDAYVPQGNPFLMPNAAKGMPGDADKRFKNLFNRGPAATADTHGGRDLSLPLLLENIALCR
ncbi:cellulose biosynthesis protein BcsO [Candidatus Sodalis endolongispinus]|uniref:Cellulose biosynthesis protein BcsO n=1 Tax=Candidatus Sodalis endolongispinus TaxID=2812662 RepID=A0ABS5YAV1_9GAMM|nr:cellulose biosynthesis protein BcsO [Candidatus Sodalis endolongispinus]MBT9431837.1 cellulose biosynthesis protein BcsO [Candidatus Sodalis endolongispinus]